METYLIWRNEREDTLDTWWADFLAEKKRRFSTGISNHSRIHRVVQSNHRSKQISLDKYESEDYSLAQAWRRSRKYPYIIITFEIFKQVSRIDLLNFLEGL